MYIIAYLIGVFTLSFEDKNRGKNKGEEGQQWIKKKINKTTSIRYF